MMHAVPFLGRQVPMMSATATRTGCKALESNNCLAMSSSGPDICHLLQELNPLISARFTLRRVGPADGFPCLWRRPNEEGLDLGVKAAGRNREAKDGEKWLWRTVLPGWMVRYNPGRSTQSWFGLFLTRRLASCSTKKVKLASYQDFQWLPLARANYRSNVI